VASTVSDYTDDPLRSLKRFALYLFAARDDSPKSPTTLPPIITGDNPLLEATPRFLRLSIIILNDWGDFPSRVDS